MKFIKKIIILGLLLALITACRAAAPDATPAPSRVPAGLTPTAAPTFTSEPKPTATTEPNTLTLMTHDSFNATEAVMAEFEKANNVKVQILRSGDAGAALNQAILSKDAPLADVFFGVDNTFFSRASASGIFEVYNSPKQADIPAELKLDPENRLLAVDYGDVCLNYDKAWFKAKGLTPPASLEDLLKPEYKGLVVVENPATSSPGLAFLLATVVHFGDPGYLDFWKKLVEQEVLVTSGWEDAYNGQFTRYNGSHPLVVSYASSPPAEVYYSEKPLADAPTASVTANGSCFRQIEFVGILTGTKHRALAEKLVDFLLSKPFQEDIPLNMFMFPANQKAQLPEVFVKYADKVTQPSTLPPADIAAKRDEWLTKWTETALR
jgi:thiamine transport system substrate-binding protein